MFNIKKLFGIEKNNLPKASFSKELLREFRAAGWVDENDNFYDEFQQAICEDVVKMLNAFGEAGHSGSSAPYALSLFNRLAEHKPLVPLTGEDWEWIDHGDNFKQNNRLYSVFKDTNHPRFGNRPYDIDAYVFYYWIKDDDGKKVKHHFRNWRSSKEISFPYSQNIITMKYPLRYEILDWITGVLKRVEFFFFPFKPYIGPNTPNQARES